MISVEALELLLKVDSAVEHHDIGLMGEARYLDAKENLQDYIASLESQLAEAKARLAGYEEGYDFATKLPALGEEVLFKNFNGYFMLYKFDGVLMPSGVISLHDDYFKKHDYDISDTRFEYRWFPLPGSKEDE